MQVTEKITVKGTKYYKAEELFESNLLLKGAGIRLVRQPNNPHDKNAVTVRLKRTGAMIGHIPKELALKYSRLLDGGRIIEATVSEAVKSGNYLDISIIVAFNDISETCKLSRLWKTALLLPPAQGVYSITCTNGGRTYIGSSRNVRARLFSHIRELEFGIHANALLGSDYNELGPDAFEASLAEKNIEACELLKRERAMVRKLLNEDADLYNMTDDGQGISNAKYKGSKISVSDRRAMDIALEDLDLYFAQNATNNGDASAPSQPSNKILSFFKNLFKKSGK